MTPRVRKISDLSDVQPIISLDVAKSQCRVDVTDEDELIGMYIEVALQAASDRLQRAVQPAMYRLTQDGFQDVIDLLKPPVRSVESVKYIDVDGQMQTLSEQDYLIDTVSEPGRLFSSSRTGWPKTKDCANAIEVTYTAGYSPENLPKPIKNWVLMAIAELYENRSKSAEKPSIPQSFANSLIDTYVIESL